MAEEYDNNESLISDNNNNDQSIIDAAKKQYFLKRYQEALDLFLKVVHNSTDSEIFVEVGNCYYMLNNYRDALEYWNKAIELNPKNAKAYTNIGNLHYKRNQFEMAISFWLVALISRPEDEATNLNLAIAFDRKDMRFESIKYFEKYLKYSENKNSAEYIKIKTKIQNCLKIGNQYLTYGVKFQADGDDKKAAACYFKSLANYPNFSKTNLNLGSIFFSDKNLELAIKYWKTSSHIEPNYGKIYSNLAISYDLMKQFDYAYCYYHRYMNFVIADKEEYDKANRRLLKIKPYLNNHPEVINRHLELANEHVACSEFYEAIDEFKNYSILKPEAKAEYKEKIQKLESYLNPEKSIIANCFEIGNKLVEEGNYAEAKNYFVRVMHLSSQQLLEYTKAKAKYSHCINAEAELNDFNR